jgi:hypothetical protein
MIHRGDYDTARKTLEVSDPEGADEAIIALHKSIEEDNQKESLTAFLSKRFSIPIFLALLIAFFNQLSGINAVIYFAPRIFELAGIGKQAAFLQSAGIGLVNLVFTMAGLYLIDRIGRRKLMLIGSVGYIIRITRLSRECLMIKRSIVNHSYHQVVKYSFINPPSVKAIKEFV